MVEATYDEALRRLLIHEGGYTNHPADPGGPTNFGITIHDYRAYKKPDASAEDVRRMVLQDAVEAAHRTDTVVHVLLVSNGMMSESAACKLTDESGGRSIVVRSEKNLEQAFDPVANALYAARFEVQEHGDVDVIEETLLGTIEAGH